MGTDAINSKIYKEPSCQGRIDCFYTRKEFQMEDWRYTLAFKIKHLT